MSCHVSSEYCFPGNNIHFVFFRNITVYLYRALANIVKVPFGFSLTEWVELLDSSCPSDDDEDDEASELAELVLYRVLG